MARQIDWAKLGWCMTQQVALGSSNASMFANGGARFAAFKSASDAVSGAYMTADARPKSIDFEHYKKELAGQKAWVEGMEKQYGSTSIPKPVDTLSAGVNADDSKVASVIEAAHSALDTAATDAAEDLKSLKALPPVAQMTWADRYRAFPELNPFTEEEMEKHYWETGFGHYNLDFAGAADDEIRKVHRPRVQAESGDDKGSWL